MLDVPRRSPEGETIVVRIKLARDGARMINRVDHRFDAVVAVDRHLVLGDIALEPFLRPGYLPLVIHCGAEGRRCWFVRAAGQFSGRATEIARIVVAHAAQGVQGSEHGKPIVCALSRVHHRCARRF